MNEETKKAILQKLNLDKPILAICEDEQRLTLYLYGGEVVQVECTPPAAQLPFAALANGEDQPVAPTEPHAVAAPNARRTNRKGYQRLVPEGMETQASSPAK